MKKPILTAEIQSAAEPAFRYQMMREVIETVRERDTLHMPLLNLVTTFIDGLASGSAAETKRAYLKYVRTHFPDLCSAIGAEIFYNKYRNPAVHEFSLRKGFGIERDATMNGAYCETRSIEGTEAELTLLNIDRLVSDFLGHVRSLQASLKNTEAKDREG